MHQILLDNVVRAPEKLSGLCSRPEEAIQVAKIAHAQNQIRGPADQLG